MSDAPMGREEAAASCPAAAAEEWEPAAWEDADVAGSDSDPFEGFGDEDVAGADREERAKTATGGGFSGGGGGASPIHSFSAPSEDAPEDAGGRAPKKDAGAVAPSPPSTAGLPSDVAPGPFVVGSSLTVITDGPVSPNVADPSVLAALFGAVVDTAVTPRDWGAHHDSHASPANSEEGFFSSLGRQKSSGGCARVL